MRIRVKHLKLGKLVFLSQLDMVNTILNALRRAKIPFALSEGFSPKPKISYGLPLPVGAGSLGEYFDLILEKRVEPQKIKKSLGKQVPELLGIQDVWEVSLQEPSIQAQVSAADYYLWQKVSGQDFEVYLKDFFSKDRWEYKDRKGREKDIKKFLINFDYLGIKQGLTGFKIKAMAGSENNFRPSDFFEIIKKTTQGRIETPGRILRCELYHRGENGSLTPFSGG